MAAVFFLLYLVLFVGLWCLGSRFAADRAGWTDMAALFATRQPPVPNRKFHGQSACMGRSGDTAPTLLCKGALHFGICGDGLLVGRPAIFRFAHPTLYIPWNELCLITTKFPHKKDSFQVREAYAISMKKLNNRITINNDELRKLIAERVENVVVDKASVGGAA